MKQNVQIVFLDIQTTKDWLINKHYAKRIPSIVHRFGCFVDGVLQGVITYGIPPSKDLCVGVCGKEWKEKVLELNRLTMLDNHKKNLTSYFVSSTLKLLPKPSIVVSYADTSMNHVGYIYQATNFYYTGLSAKRKEWKEKTSTLHNKSVTTRHTLEELQKNENFLFVDRPQKHRYVYFTGTKKQIKKLKKDLNYKILPYPKGQSKQYDNKKDVAQQMTFL
tara:strand:- start:1177 stop:1836 length:660 start_codon:yes stop_codon:yes gene_type:complete